MESETETKVRQVFSTLGYEVDRIPESTDPGVETADYRIRDSNDSYVIEVKDKSDDNALLADYDEKMESGNVFVRTESTGYKNAVSNILDVAERQLTVTAESEKEFRLVWLELAGIDRTLGLQQAMATIYGTVQLLPIGKALVTKDCYYFKHSVVHRNPNIDGFIISDGDSMGFAANPFSPRARVLRSSKLFAFFADRDAVRDPVALEQAGTIYVADCDIPRRDTQAVREYVQQKYGVDRFLDLEPNCTTATVKIKH